MSEKTSVAVSAATHRALMDLAQETNNSVDKVLEQAIETHRRQLFLERTNEAFAALRNDEQAWREYSAEVESWDATLHDGL